MEQKNSKYTIKSIKTDKLNLAYNIENNIFILLDIDKTVLNNNIVSKFELEYLHENNYNLLFYHKKKQIKKEIILIFSSNKIHNPLFFNIYIKNSSNTYDILKSNCLSPLCKSHNIIKENINSTNFKSNGKYIFHLNYHNLKPCRIKLNNKDFNVYGYTKSATINPNNKSEHTCNVNRNLKNSWKVKKDDKCSHIDFDDDKNSKKNLNSCAIDNKFETLLHNIPSIQYIYKNYPKQKRRFEAGQMELKTQNAKNNIQNTIGDKRTDATLQRMESTIDPEYKDTMNESIRQFENVDKEDYTKENYINLLKNIYDLSKEYKLSGKYKTCTGNKLSNVCNVDSIIDCQKKCNQIYDCAHISYDRNKKTCKLYNTCGTFKKNFNYSTYTKTSLLRNNGYNIYNAILMYKNPPIPNLPWYIRIATLFCGIIIILCVSMILFKLTKAFSRFFMCIYYDSCYYPTELLNPFSTAGPSQRYI